MKNQNKEYAQVNMACQEANQTPQLTAKVELQLTAERSNIHNKNTF